MPNQEAAAPAVRNIPIDRLKSNPWNRTIFDPEPLKELATNIKAEGIKERLLGWNPFRALRKAPPDLQLQVAQELQAGTLKPDQIEKRLNQLRFSGKTPGSPGKNHPPDPYSELWDHLQDNLQDLTRECWGVTSTSPKKGMNGAWPNGAIKQV